MQLLKRAFDTFLGSAKTDAPPPQSDSAWRAGENMPTGIADSDQALKQNILSLARIPGVERLVLLRANGGLFCGRFDGSRESFSHAVHTVTSSARKAARRMGLGAIKSVVVEGPQGSFVVAVGHSACGVQCSGEVDPEYVLQGIACLTGQSSQGGGR